MSSTFYQGSQHGYQIITNAQVFCLSKQGQAIYPTFETKTVVIANGKIEKITNDSAGSLLLNQPDVEVINGEGCYLTPGLIDIHINGALGCDFNQDKLHSIQNVMKQLPQHGITHILPTVITASADDMIATTHTLEAAIHNQENTDTQIAGIHLEGPFINSEKKGIHPESGIQQPTTEFLDQLLSPNVKIMTMAPEIDPEGLLIAELKRRNITVAAGHTQATQTQMNMAVKNGLTGATHLFNAMRSLHHREPGVIAEALLSPGVFIELITDGVHVHPSMVALAIKAKGISQTILTADSITLAGTANGTQGIFAGQNIQMDESTPTNAEGTLAGGGLLLDDCVRNVVEWTIATFAQAVYMATTAPAVYLGLDSEIGSITEGRAAHLVLWDQKDLSPRQTWINGQSVYNLQPVTA